MAAGESGLSALAGLPLGLMMADGTDEDLSARLISYVERYQRNLSRLGAESKKALTEFFLEVLQTVEGEKV